MKVTPYIADHHETAILNSEVLSYCFRSKDLKRYRSHLPCGWFGGVIDILFILRSVLNGGYMKRSKFFLVLGMMCIAPLTWSQVAYPDHPVRVIVPTSPGSSMDFTARVLSEELARIFGQPFIVENRAGADGIIGVTFAKSQPADGYTLLFGANSTMSVNPLVKKNLPYDPVEDFKPVYGLVQSMNVILVPPESKFNSLADLVSAGKTSGTLLNVATSFPAYHLAMAWLGNLAGFKINNIPYKGTPQVLTDVMGGLVDVAMTDLSVARPLIKSGKIKAIAVAGATRDPELPNIPTVKESGYPDYVAFAWNALFVRSDTPKEITAKLVKAIQSAMTTEAWDKFVKKAGGQNLALNADAMHEFHAKEISNYRKVAETAGIKPE